MQPLKTLLTELIDYAGLFPPAQLDMATAVANYAAYRAGSDSWALGRFVLPASRLEEFVEAASSHFVATRSRWRLSVLLGPELGADLARVTAFNERHGRRVLVDVLEGKGANPEEISALAASLNSTLLPPVSSLFVEIPLGGDPAPLVRAIGEAGANAKIRTGGTTEAAIPSAEQVADFLVACVGADVSFKATAGLHHPLRAEHRLTYADDAPRATMHGYLNVFLAAALLREGGSREDAVRLLEEQSPDAIAATPTLVVWRGRTFRDPSMITLRLRAVSFGSCSFTEPMDDLRALSMHPLHPAA